MSRDIDERCWWCDEDLEGQVLTEHIKKHPITAFEAEVANMVSIMDFCDHFCCDLPANVCRVRSLAKEIECLLAQERERLQNEIQAYQSDPRYDNRYLQGQDDMREPMECGHPKACIEYVPEEFSEPGGTALVIGCSVCAEREKVREMCANKAENTIYYREVDVLETDPNRLKKQIAVHIHQLPLTAPNREKGK